MRNWLTGAIALSLLAGCGGGGGSSAPTSGGGPISSPSPTPTPTGTPTPTPVPDPGGAKLGGLAIPGGMTGLAICTDAQPVQADGRVVDVANGAINPNSVSIQVEADFTYAVELGGFGGPTFQTSDRRGGGNFEVFVAENDGLQTELQIAKFSTRYGTYGLVAYGNLCFYAAAPFFAPSGPPNTNASYGGYIDGLTQIGGDDDRLTGLVAQMVFNQATSRYDLTIFLASVEEAFAEPQGQSITQLGEATASLRLVDRNFEEAPLTGHAGFTGTVSGLLAGENDQAALLIFSLTNASGDRIWGVVSMDSITFPP